MIEHRKPQHSKQLRGAMKHMPAAKFRNILKVLNLTQLDKLITQAQAEKDSR